MSRRSSSVHTQSRNACFDFISFLHGGGGQFLVDDHDGPALVVMLAAFLLHLDGFCS